MFAVSLTSIPPRFSQLQAVIEALWAQDRKPDQVFLTIPQRYARFGSGHELPDLHNVTLLRPEKDDGPAAKVLTASARVPPDSDLIYCDDDWLYGPGWASALLNARTRVDSVVAAAPFSVGRLKRQGGSIAQGYAGVLIRAGFILPEMHNPPADAWPVDDIWLSGHFERQDLPMLRAEAARAQCTPLSDPGRLQDNPMNGKSRAEANQACAAYMHNTYGIWPPL